MKTCLTGIDAANEQLYSKVDGAKLHLLEICQEHFTDKTFKNYIETKLAGDFACEISAYIESLVSQYEIALIESNDREAYESSLSSSRLLACAKLNAHIDQLTSSLSKKDAEIESLKLALKKQEAKSKFHLRFGLF